MLENKKLKLWVVRVTRTAYVLAEDPMSAESQVTDIERWETPSVDVCSGSVDLGWESNCFVYHDDTTRDISLDEARRHYPIGVQTDAHE